MSEPSSAPVSRDDLVLLADLGRLATEIDPPPVLVMELGRAAFATRRLDEQLVELVADSQESRAGVRSVASDLRLLSFEAADLTIEVQVSTAGDDLLLLGQVIPEPAAGGSVAVESAAGELARAELDDLGSFRVDDVGPGPFRLVLRRPGQPPVATTWVTL